MTGKTISVDTPQEFGSVLLETKGKEEAKKKIIFSCNLTHAEIFHIYSELRSRLKFLPDY